ncbi:MAG TPA: NUDIX domain-containing protein [Levilactobacillus hammesii]|uniref:NUDIX domain-containing protein n=1 Tax=Levilactobacillus hammesii TaxID=267633 RepID=A0A921F027_9LACO|nr:NUDIX domain-containing protein [Levilactobacillus hammesii]
MSQPEITITNIIWSFDHTTQQVNVLLLKRAEAPFQNYWALPETTMRFNESADDAALRLVREKIGLRLDSFHTEQLATFTHPRRAPEPRALSLAYMTFLPERPALTPGYGATAAKWFTFTPATDHYAVQAAATSFATPATTDQAGYYAQLLKRPTTASDNLAFDHAWILGNACARIRNKLDYQPNILLILGPTFTLKAARTIYATFLRVPVTTIDNSNFKKNHQHLFTAVGTTAPQHAGRPAKLFRLNYLP